MRFRILTIVLAILLVMRISAFPQKGSPASSGHFATFRELLESRNIDLTTSSLIGALQNRDSHVRYLAALVLAEDKATTAIPAIKEALTAEKIPETRVNIALALAQLGDAQGFTALESTCNNTDAPAYVRMYSAKYLLDLHKESCLDTVVMVAQSADDFGSRIAALSLLPRFQHTSASSSQEILAAILKALSDRESVVRIAASDALGVLGDTSALPYLQHAIVSEQDETVRSRFQADLERLQGKEQH
jgi:HEAT repeat protein